MASRAEVGNLLGHAVEVHPGAEIGQNAGHGEPLKLISRPNIKGVGRAADIVQTLVDKFPGNAQRQILIEAIGKRQSAGSIVGRNLLTGGIAADIIAVNLTVTKVGDRNGHTGPVACLERQRAVFHLDILIP